MDLTVSLSFSASTGTEQLELKQKNVWSKDAQQELMAVTRTPSLKMTQSVLLVRLPFLVERRVKRKQAVGSVNFCRCKVSAFMPGRHSSQVTTKEALGCKCAAASKLMARDDVSASSLCCHRLRLQPNFQEFFPAKAMRGNRRPAN